MNQWYVIKTKPKQEKCVQSQLSRLGCELFMPQIEGVLAPKPLFPSYLFVKTNLNDAIIYRKVRYTRGVSSILGDHLCPRSIASEIVEALRERTSDGSLIKQDMLYHIGDHIRVKRGIMKDLVGVVEKHLPAAERVQILFKWWATTMRAQLKYSQIERAA